MPTLKKTKSYSVSNEIVEVNFQGATVQCANLLKSGLLNQTAILVAHEDKWHEINCLDLGADNSDLQAFKIHVELHNLSLTDLGIITEKPVIDNKLTHNDFMALSEKFPMYDYIQISKLNDYLLASGTKVSIQDELKFMTEKGLTVEQNISNIEDSKKRIINEYQDNSKIRGVSHIKSALEVIDLVVGENNQTAILCETALNTLEELKHNRISDLMKLGFEYNDVKEYVGFGFIIHEKNISSMNTEEWSHVLNSSIASRVRFIGFEEKEGGIDLEYLPALPTAQEQPTKKPISIQVFETLTPDRIKELQGLKESQIEIVEANPFVKITSKETYETAKKSAGILLKASTAIDGKDGIESNATKYLNSFKNMLKGALQPLAKITREAYDKQKAENSAWENAEEIRIQNEQREKLLKIKNRTDELFAVPFTFNGTIYSIGTVYVLPSQIENVTDEEFKVLVDNGKAVKVLLDQETKKQSAVEEENKKLREQLAALMALNNMSNTENDITPEVPENQKAKVVSLPPNVSFEPSSGNTASTPTPNQAVRTNIVELPPADNVLLNKLDLENVEHVEKPAYQKCRSYYVRGLVDVANMIESILVNPDVTVKKSVKITELVAILKKSK